MVPSKAIERHMQIIAAVNPANYGGNNKKGNNRNVYNKMPVPWARSSSTAVPSNNNGGPKASKKHYAI
jgi:hypothetical protein